MTTQNMKLLDLQTGKYLKLGKDFYYGGDSIYLIERLEQCLKSHNKWLVSLISIALKCIHSSNQRNISYELAQKVVDNQEITEDIVVNSQSQSGVITKSETPVIHGNECVYGGRYVLMSEIDCDIKGNIYKNKDLANQHTLTVEEMPSQTHGMN